MQLLKGLKKKLLSEIPCWLASSKNSYVLVTDEIGEILFANDYYREEFLAHSQSPPANFTDILHPSDIPEMKNGMLACTNNGRKSPYTIINKSRVSNSNNYKSIKWECSIFDSSSEGKPLLIHLGHDVVIMENESEYKSKTSNSLNELIDDLQIGVVIQDVNSNILLSNQKAEELLGVSKNDLHGRPADHEEWEIIKEDETEFPTQELPVAQAIATKKYVHDVMMGVYNPKKEDYLWFLVDSNPQLNEEGEVERVVTTFIDVSDRIKAENAIKKQQQQLQIMMNHAPMVIFLKDISGKYLFFNNLYKSFLGKDLKPGITDYDIFDKDFADWCKNKDREVIENDKIINFKHRIGEQVFDETKFPIKDSNENVYALGGFSQNITKQKKEEERLKLLEKVITSTEDAVLITKVEGTDISEFKIMYANQAFYNLTGYSEEEVMGRNPLFLQGENTDKQKLLRLKKAQENLEACELQIINYKKDKTEFWVNLRLVPVTDEEGNCTHWISVHQDITERVRQEKVLKKALSEKTTLLSEIHHRVKNNLAIVSGLLELQSMEVEDPIKIPLKRSINRIQSIAMVHELMYQTEQLSSVNLKNYLDKLIPGIYRTMQSDKEIKINQNVQNCKVNINQAIPLGLLMNELLTNSFKYAFQETDVGQINISIEIEDGKLDFSYNDSGPGFKHDNDFKDTNSLGLSLINAQLEQLHADYQVNTEGRFELSFSFSISKRGPHSNIR
ncbi:MAG: hypothetical protein CL670_14510 [Balneola sp.]|nr:hypothetical protein [Balneola sp.]MBE80368.1 hypothetical protein [Balneola sp.]